VKRKSYGRGTSLAAGKYTGDEVNISFGSFDEARVESLFTLQTAKVKV
jgi:hypothetical protein